MLRRKRTGAAGGGGGGTAAGPRQSKEKGRRGRRCPPDLRRRGRRKRLCDAPDAPDAAVALWLSASSGAITPQSGSVLIKKEHCTLKLPMEAGAGVRRAVRHESCLALGPSRAPHSARLSPSAAEWVTVGPVWVGDRRSGVGPGWPTVEQWRRGRSNKSAWPRQLAGPIMALSCRQCGHGTTSVTSMESNEL